MIAPDFIWAEEPEIFDGMGFWQENQSAGLTAYIRRDPSVIAALPEVRALVAGARAEGMRRAEASINEALWSALPLDTIINVARVEAAQKSAADAIPRRSRRDGSATGGGE